MLFMSGILPPINGAPFLADFNNEDCPLGQTWNIHDNKCVSEDDEDDYHYADGADEEYVRR